MYSTRGLSKVGVHARSERIIFILLTLIVIIILLIATLGTDARQ